MGLLIIFSNILFKKIRIIDFIILILTILMIIIVGSRGPLVFAMLYLIYKILTKTRITAWGSITALILVNIVLFSALFLDNFSITMLLQKLNIDARTLSLILENRFLESNARVSLLNSSIKLIESRIMLGYGIFGERAILGTYPHSVVLELIMNYGLLLGTFLICIFGILIFNCSVSKKKKFHRVYILFMFIGLFPLVFSGSYLTNIPFYIFLGITIGHYIRHNGKIVAN